ncbi:MAG TPA: hypothetical protein VFX65_11330, partial [Candidatus Limnocylindrales bacterium]|nr:hypothetical protein [Candidatus Limnocylindrales bacterium]
MRSSTVVAAAAVAVLGLAVGLRLADGLASGLDLDVLVPCLIAAGCLCIAGLTRRIASSLAGLSLGLGALLGAIEAIAVVRAWLPATSPGDRPLLVALAGAAGAAATLVAWRSFTASLGQPGTDSRRRQETLGTALVVGIVAVAYGVAIAGAATDLVGADAGSASPLRVATRLMLGIAAGSLLLGATAVALPRFGRAWRKARASGSRSLVDTLIDEFVPRLGGGRLAA